ncbi:hypothetical protein Pfo_007729 [Paulownia fortunei]|nr:hypothetical protein Pfo_007729 [Paulownia fortunei]
MKGICEIPSHSPTPHTPNQNPHFPPPEGPAIAMGRHYRVVTISTASGGPIDLPHSVTLHFSAFDNPLLCKPPLVCSSPVLLTEPLGRGHYLPANSAEPAPIYSGNRVFWKTWGSKELGDLAPRKAGSELKGSCNFSVIFPMGKGCKASTSRMRS